MKTAVLGLFDDLDDARRTLAQLAASPLDMSSVQVVHRDADTQRTLSDEAGLPPRRSAVAGLAAGAIVGGVGGAVAGSGAGPLSALGALLAGAAGASLGAIGGLFAGARSGALGIPPDQRRIVLDSIDDGATAIVVLTGKIPTARAIRDLFQMNGSRTLQTDLETDAALMPDEDEVALPSRAFAEDRGAVASRDAYARFRPPWRRRGSDETADRDLGANDEADHS